MIKKIIDTSRYVRASEMMKGAKKVNVSEEVRKEVAKEKSERVLDDFRMRQNAAWSKLWNKTVGGEDE